MFRGSVESSYPLMVIFFNNLTLKIGISSFQYLSGLPARFYGRGGGLHAGWPEKDHPAALGDGQTIEGWLTHGEEPVVHADV
jgi:hypothetical protein